MLIESLNPSVRKHLFYSSSVEAEFRCKGPVAQGWKRLRPVMGLGFLPSEQRNTRKTECKHYLVVSLQCI